MIRLLGSVCFGAGLLGLFAVGKGQRGWKGWDRRERITCVVSLVLALGGVLVGFPLW